MPGKKPTVGKLLSVRLRPEDVVNLHLVMQARTIENPSQVIRWMLSVHGSKARLESEAKTLRQEKDLSRKNG